ncbi:MAG: ATP-dependent Clp protease proteolytic subunit [Clostridia bacterium]|nr:ATP-dependent Clp protease proteolytic subunit [Clostridia bacterium]
MMIQQKSSGGLHLIPSETKLLADRIVFLEGEIDADSANEFGREMLFLVHEDPEAPITVIINSEGGEVNSGLLVYDIIRTCGVPVRTVCTGKAFSMAAVILACGTMKRCALPHAEILIHEPLLGNRISGSTSSLKSISDSLLTIKRKMNAILAELTGHSEDEIDQATSYDHLLNAEEAREFGFIDEIIDFRNIAARR